MKRREFLALASAAAAFPRVALAQQAAKVPRIAFVYAVTTLPDQVQAVEQGLGDFGYVDGRTIALERQSGTLDELPTIMAKAVASQPDVIVTVGPGGRVATSATKAIPIVFGNVGYPAELGMVASLPHPGGNATGNINQNADIQAKKIQLVKAMIPTMARIAYLSFPSDPVDPLAKVDFVQGAAANGIDPVVIEFNSSELAPQFDRVITAAPQAMSSYGIPYFASQSDLLSTLQIKNRIALLGNGATTSPRALLNYGPNAAALVRGTGFYVDAILKGAKPADLPVQTPKTFDLSVNLSTAKALGITIPTLILAQATAVIE